jgi:hypothetical protein
MKTFLFLDDIRLPIDAIPFAEAKGINQAIYYENWVIVKSYNQFVKHIQDKGLPDIISFDHDLGDDNELTGMDCAKWLVNYCMDNNLYLPKWVVHSANPAGYENIKSLLLSFEKNQKIS